MNSLYIIGRNKGNPFASLRFPLDPSLAGKPRFFRNPPDFQTPHPLPLLIEYDPLIILIGKKRRGSQGEPKVPLLP